MATPAELLQEGVKYDPNMDKTASIEEYLKMQSKQITPIINGNKLITQRSFNLSGDCRIFYIDIDVTSSSTVRGVFTNHWNETPLQAKLKVLQTIGRNLKTSEHLLGMLENCYRSVPKEDISNYDLPIVMEFIDSHFEMWNDNKDTDIKCIVFEENKASFHWLALSVLQALAQTSRVVVVATQASAPVAHLFVTLCLQSGIPNNTIQFYIVDKAQLEDVSIASMFFEQLLSGTLYEAPSEVAPGRGGCSVVVTESADLHSALDLLISGVTFTRLYPWAVSSVLVQESVYAKFQAMAEAKLNKAVLGDSSAFVTPPGSDLMKFPGANGPALVFGDSRIIDMGTAVTMQLYRTTKELLNLLKYPARFALSLWCDSVSVANEISVAAEVSTVWINMYGVFDLSPQTPVLEKHGGMIRQLGAEKILYRRHYTINNQYEETKQQLLANVSNLKDMQSKWMKRSRSDKVSRILDTLKNIPQELLTAEETEDIIELVQKLQSDFRISNSDVKITIRTMNIRILQPIGKVMMQGNIDTDVLGDAIVSVLDGNSILYIAGDHPTLSTAIFEHLSKAPEIPVLALESCLKFCERLEVAYATKMFDAIIRRGFHKFYKGKNIWSPIGESFAN